MYPVAALEEVVKLAFQVEVFANLVIVIHIALEDVFYIRIEFIMFSAFKTSMSFLKNILILINSNIVHNEKNLRINGGPRA